LFQPIRLVLFATILALAATACGSDRPAASVNGAAITLDDVVAIAPSVAGEASLDAEQTREVLSGLIIESALVQAAEEQYGVVITEAEIDERLANPPPRYAGVFGDLAAADATTAQFRSQALRSLVRDAVVPKIVADEGTVSAFLEENRAFATRLCAQVLVFIDEDLANESATRLQAGEEFVVVAGDAGQADPGRVGALDTSEVCPDFASSLDESIVEMALTVPTGEFVGPVEVSTGFAVMRVTNRLEPDAESGDLVELVDGRLVSQLFTPWLNDAMRVAVIEIDPSIGTWSVSGVGIIAPE